MVLPSQHTAGGAVPPPWNGTQSSSWAQLVGSGARVSSATASADSQGLGCTAGRGSVVGVFVDSPRSFDGLREHADASAKTQIKELAAMRGW
jgi:hypothetical protein